MKDKGSHNNLNLKYEVDIEEQFEFKDEHMTKLNLYHIRDTYSKQKMIKIQNISHYPK